MKRDVSRRNFVGAAGAAAVAGLAGQVAAEPTARAAGKAIKIVGVCCSPRKGKTTAASLRVCLDAAGAVDAKIETELIELAGMVIPGQLAAGVPLAQGHRDDFPKLAAKLADPKVRGIIIGTPVYFSNMTALCKAFLDRWMVFRKQFELADKVAGVLAIGAARNGGQELTIQSVQAALFCHDMIVVGAARPTSRFGAAVWSKAGKTLADDKAGMDAAKNLGRRVAQVALRLSGGTG